MQKIRSLLCCWAPMMLAAGLFTPSLDAASVTGSGYTNDFGSQPLAADWSTFSVAGGSGDVTTGGGADSAVQLVAASSITAGTVLDAASPAAFNASATWSSSGFYLQTRPTGNQATLLMCTLVNNIGFNASSVTIGYDLGSTTPAAEEVDGHRAYYSLTGAAGSWVVIPEFSTATPGRMTSTLNIAWTAGAPLYILWSDDNGSGSPDSDFRMDNFSATAVPAVQIPVSITGDPVSQTVAELQQPVIFTVVASGNPAPTYQWYTNGVAISGATSSTYSNSSVPLHFNGLNFRAVARNVANSITYNATSSVATLTVNADAVSPVLLGASQAGNNQILASFSERLAAASATNLANYAITSSLGVLTISNAVLDVSQTNVLFTVAPLTPGATYTLTVIGLQDQSAAANLVAANSQATFTAASITYVNIGSPVLPGSLVDAGNGFDVTSGGTNISGTADQFAFGYQQTAGDFDVKVRVEAFSANASLAIASLMARESLAANSRFAASVATPSVMGSYFLSRATTAASAVSAGWFPVNYPYTWLRLQRVGNLFTGFGSFDGNSWVQLGSVTLGAAPSSMYVGFAVSSANSAQLAAAQFRDSGTAVGGALVPYTANREPLGASSRRTGLVISEIMYHPKTRPDGKQVEFIEIYNSLPYFENLTGHRLSGDVNYAFPSNTILPGGGFLVLAKIKSDVESAYGISGVLQYGVTNGIDINENPIVENGLNNAGGSVKLHGLAGQVLLDASFGTKYPWPIEADGGGHSLVLARPSYGEGSRLAWAASDSTGGSPGRYDPIAADPAGNVVINEFLAHTDPPQEDMIELYNHGTAPVDISGFWLSDTVTTNKFRIPNGTTLNGRAFIAFNQTALGFALTASGEQIVLVNSNQTRVIDAIGFDGQENGVAMGRYPDGAPRFQRLSAVTAGTTNAVPTNSPIVINEIMYNPITGNSDDEFIEIYNRGNSAVNIGDWRFTDGIDYTFPKNTVMQPGSYFVVARSKAQLLANNYTALNVTNLFGNYDGSLANSGEHVVLSAPDYEVSTNGSGQVLTNVSFRYAMNDVTYSKGGRWGVWSDGGGSSLELIDPRSDTQLAANWADSDETTKSTWTSFEATGSVDDEWGGQTHDNIHVYLLGIGECLVDDIEVRPQPGNANIMINGGFENGLSNWTPQGSHDQSSIEDVGFSGARSLHLRGASRGDTGANKVRSNTGNSFTTTFGLTTVVTMRAKARWLRGFPEVLLRFHGGGMEAAGRLPVPKNLGTPGGVNSRYQNNSGPAVYDVVHSPILPAASAAVVVTARATDPDGLSSLLLRYRLDPSATFNNVAMVDNGTGGDAVAGDGLFSATIPGQNSGTLAAFHIQAADNAVAKATNLFPANALTRVFPIDSPKRECLVRWGEEQLPGSYSTYHFWLTQETIDRWTSRVRLNNAGLDATFVYNNFRVVYNMMPQYGGSVWHVGQMVSPVAPGTRVDYVLNFPEDDLLLGQTDFVLNTIGNPSGDTASDGSAQSEQTSYILFRQMGVHYNYRRYIHLFVNGSRRSTTGGVPFIMEDSQQPNGDIVKEWWPSDSEGQLYKIEDRFEYNDAGDSHGGNEGNAQLTRQMALYNGVNQLKLAHYRFMFRKRSVSAAESASDYTNLFAMVDIVSPTTNATISPLPDHLVKQFSQVADLEQWMRIFCVQHTVGNWDSYGYRRGKNAYTYRPNLGKFGMMTWDIDFTMGVGGDGTGQDIFQVNDPRIAALFATPEVRRMYWRAMRDMTDGPLNNSYLDPILDAKMAAHLANGVQAQASVVATIKSYVAGRRSFIVSQIPNAAFNFSSPTSFTSSSNIVTLTGTAPIEIKYFEINGIAYPVTWTSETAWSVRVPVSVSGSNNFAFQGFGRLSNAIPNTARSITVDYTGAIEGAETNIVFNEIMYNPLVPGAEYVELFNRSTNFTFDLSGWRINGLDYTFPEGATMGPRAFLVLTKDRVQYANAYGGLAPAFDQFTGELQLDGETLSVIKPAATTNEVDLVVDRVRYDGALPWPAAANGTGSAFQLIDSSQDNARVGNWFSSYTPAVYCCGSSTPEILHAGWRFVSATGAAGPGAGGNQMRLVINLGSGDINGSSVVIDDVSVVEGTNAAVGSNLVRNGDFETGSLLEVPPVTNSWFIGTNYTNTAIVGDPVHGGSGALKIVCSTFGNAQPRVISQLLSPAPLTNAVHTLSFWYNATNTATNLTVKLLNSGPLNVVTNVGVFITPSNYVPPSLVSPAINTRSPGAANQQTTNLPAFQTLWINELQADNVSGLLDNNGEREPWIEIYNAGSAAVSLDGLYLSTSYTNLTSYAIPSGYSIGPNQFMVIVCDGQPAQSTPAQLHTDFELPSGSGSIALSRLYTNAPQVLDYVNYTGISANRSYGSFPDGQPFFRQEFFYVTAGGTNDGRSAPLVVFINEWMANNTNYIADPADNDYDDWFELYNPSTNAVDIAGYYLTDTLANKFKYLITTNGPHIIPAQGFLLVWADNETGQNVSGGVPREDLHVNFQLATAGEAIGMFAADGTQIDAITFTNAPGNVSEGRYPNGGTLVYAMPVNQTPRASNYLPGIGNNPPVLDPIGTKTVFVSYPLVFTATASDPDPGQVLGYTLDAGSPPGAVIDFNTGAFSWTPGVAGTNIIAVRVSDNGVPALDDYENVVVRVLSLPSITSPSLIGNDLTLSWSALAGRTYQVQYKNSLADQDWTNLGLPLTLESGGTLTINDDITNSPTKQRYYKVVVQP